MPNSTKNSQNGASNIIKKPSKHNDGCTKMRKNDKNGTPKTKIIELIKENFDKCKSSKELLNLLIDNNLKISRRTLFTILKGLNLSFTQSAKGVQNTVKYSQNTVKDNDTIIKEQSAKVLPNTAKTVSSSTKNIIKEHTEDTKELIKAK